MARVELIPKPKAASRPALGAEYFTEPYANILLLAKKNSGKTTIIYNIIKNCAGPNTEVIIFCPTWRRDDNYKHIIKHMNKRKIEHQEYTSLYDGKTNILAAFLNELGNASDSEPDSEDEEPPDPIDLCHLVHCAEDKEKEKKPRASRYIAPDFIFIFDDMKKQNRDLIIDKLIATNRHFKAKVILSTQFVTDIAPGTLANLDVALLFPKIPAERIESIYAAFDLANIRPEEFARMYNQATSTDHHFLYVDLRADKFRVNFDEHI
jgi:hypothetical protein